MGTIVNNPFLRSHHMYILTLCVCVCVCVCVYVCGYVCVCIGATLLWGDCLGGTSLKECHWGQAVSTMVL